MKNKLKLFVASVLVFVMAFAFAACGETDVVGTWVLKECSATMQGASVDMVEMGMEIELEIKDDSTFDMTITMPELLGGDSDTMSGTWELKDGTLTLSGEGGESSEEYLGSDAFKVENGKLTISHSEDGISMSVVLEKK